MSLWPNSKGGTFRPCDITVSATLTRDTMSSITPTYNRYDKHPFIMKAPCVVVTRISIAHSTLQAIDAGEKALNRSA